MKTELSRMSLWVKYSRVPRQGRYAAIWATMLILASSTLALFENNKDALISRDSTLNSHCLLSLMEPNGGCNEISTCLKLRSGRSLPDHAGCHVRWSSQWGQSRAPGHFLQESWVWRANFDLWKSFQCRRPCQEDFWQIKGVEFRNRRLYFTCGNQDILRINPCSFTNIVWETLGARKHRIRPWLLFTAVLKAVYISFLDSALQVA